MKILFAQDALHAAGGVESYLAHVIPALRARGHSVAILYAERRDTAALVRGVDGPIVGVAGRGLDGVVAELRRWGADVCFSHNMAPLHVERRLLGEWPVVKFMHGYFGTCVSALKMHAFPGHSVCERTLGVACLALYGPRRCGPLRPGAMVRGYRWANGQRRLLDRYAAVVVASAHMAAEFSRHGVAGDRLKLIPLFPTITPSSPQHTPGTSVLFLGRMTSLKGGDILIDAVARASAALLRPVPLVMAGDGPQRAAWERRAASAGVSAAFPGWLDPSSRNEALANAAVLAVPSVWPEPFGLVGLEAASMGVPSVAFDVGGIPEWLHHRTNGLLVPSAGGSRAFASSLEEVLDDAPLRARLGAGALVRAKQLSLDAHVRALLDVLEQAASLTGRRVVAAR